MKEILVGLYHRWCRPHRDLSPTSSPARARKTRFCLESLEERYLPASPGGGASADLPPFAPGAPWSDSANRAFVAAQSPTELQAMYFNSPAQDELYMTYFRGALHRWVAAADRAGLRSDADLMQFLGRELDAKFGQTRHALAHLYPGQSDQTYRLLMAMNLADGYYTYATTFGSHRSVYRQLHLPTGDCSEIADLLSLLVRAQGLAAQEIAQSYNYPSPLGPFVSDHVAVYAGGLWLDAEANTAFALDLRHLQQIPAGSRLPDLLDSHRVFGFYNDYLQPQVRQEQLRRGLDGGIIAFYYQYYFAGIGDGHTQIQLLPSS